MKFHHCPNPECSKFADQNNQRWYWKRGNYYSKGQGKIQRYQCKTCRKTFTPRTFSIDYYTKRPFNYSKLTSQLISASGINDISRNMKVSVSTVINRCERLARNYIAIHAELLDETMAEHARPASEEFLPENIAADGFESFSQSQYFPHHINIFAGEKSEYIYALGFSNLRRKGRMTFAQKSKRSLLETLEKADPQAIESSFRNVTEYIIQLLDKHKVTKPKQLTTDQHKAYSRAFSKIENFSQHFNHVTISSRATRDFKNPLFSLNYIDRQIRKDNSDHTRETVQFSKCPNSMMMRMIIYRHQHNYLNARRVKAERKGDKETHAEKAGLSEKKLKKALRKYSKKRVFFNKINLSKEERSTWLCEWRNPGMKSGRNIPSYIKA